MTETIQINCLFSGESERQMFSVRISPDKTVYDLKTASKSNIQTLSNFDAKGIRLVKVSLAPSDACLASKPSKIKGEEELFSLSAKIKDTFGNLPSGVVHAVVLPPNESDPKLAWLYEKAWGKEWPQHEGTILRTDVVPTSASQSIAMDIDGNQNKDQDNNPVLSTTTTEQAELKYTCLSGMIKVAQFLGMPTEMQDVLLIRNEYLRLVEVIAHVHNVKLKGGLCAVLVTGQPGIGLYQRKSAFLLYLLLHRLERKLPTAVQFSPDEYIIFDEEGANTIPSIPLGSFRDRMRLDKCWALTDSSINLTRPSDLFLGTPEVLIQTSSPKPREWRRWVDQTMACTLVSELPSMLEITAILKELGYNPIDAFHFVNKWGPCTRTIIKIMAARDRVGVETGLKTLAVQAAKEIWAGPSSFTTSKDLIPDKGSTLLFIRPVPNVKASNLCLSFIPTGYLMDVFDECRTMLSKKNALALFRGFSSHSQTGADWGYELAVHNRFCKGGAALPISRVGSVDTLVRPSTNLLPGTEAFLKSAVPDTAFYWIPATINLPGIDGVLGDNAGNVYAIQGTIASAYRSPVEGLKSLWDKVGPRLRAGGCHLWHFVIIADSKLTVDELVPVISQELENQRDMPFISEEGRMEVCGCVIPNESETISDAWLDLVL
ncbi:hypothetical protein D9611_000836 [Ephemerocybe angulata]|uniref:Crinkler effector protein N-terminal domain-containing protein n=1 Tax=Ephemerocybe angulata TaxID=980116 RepID=A0A8H5F737_9AGAR|nr:hypothetical protein D9611_000836 [Tulosesus angulatus]